jgi:hypothetical protein
MKEAIVERLSEALRPVQGLAALVLGGSRARGVASGPFPNQSRQALISRFHWEVIFSIENAEIAVHRDEQTHIAGCAYRALCCVAQVLFAVNRRYLINEKGALAEAGSFPETVGGLAGTSAEIWAAIGVREFASALRLLRRTASDLDALVARSNSK